MVGGREAVIHHHLVSLGAWEGLTYRVLGCFPRVQRNLTSSAQLNQDLLNSKNLELQSAG